LRAGQEIQIDLAGGAEESLALAYLSLPAADSGIGILVVHEAWGLVDEVRDVCDRLAREGFVALAPDLYAGRSTRVQEEAQQFVADLEIPRAMAILDAAQARLLGHEAVSSSRLGVLGFCLGGQLALATACGSARIGAVVDCYGVHPEIEFDFAQLDAPVLGIFAENDAWISADHVRRLAADLEAAGKRCHFSTHLGVQHGFMNPARAEAYDAATSEEAWKQLLAFLRAELSASR